MSERKRILVLGASGMLGHKLVSRLSAEFAVAGTVRDRQPSPVLRRMLPGIRIYPNVNAEDIEALRGTIADWAAAVVVNCIGIVKQAKAASEPVPSIRINALLPHQLYGLAAERGARLIHFSTDCVFSGRRGPYVESDIPDAEDLYGRTKLLGEVCGPGALTLRTSLVGRELHGHRGLIAWFLGQRQGTTRSSRVRGFANALFSGLTTPAASDLVARIIRSHPDLDGVWHASAEAISKHDLLHLVNRVYRLGIEIERDDTIAIDRRLDSTRLRIRTGWRPPPWNDMIAAMHAEDAIYDDTMPDGATQDDATQDDAT
jgi:dTDP-4-dehydrorhamnose reductase